MAHDRWTTNTDGNSRHTPSSGISSNNLERSLLDAFEELRAGDEELRRESDQLAETHQQANTERRHYRDLFRYAPDAYIISDGVGRIQDANQAAVRLLNSGTVKLSGMPLLLFVIEENRRHFQRYLTELRHTDEAVHAYVSVLPFQNGPVDVSVTAVRGHEPYTGTDVIKWILRDVTEWRAAEQEIHRLNTQLDTRATERTVQLKNALARERQARHDAEQATQRVEFLSEASRAFSESLDGNDTLQRIVKFAVPYLADLCKIDLVDDDGRLQREAFAHQEPAIVEKLVTRAERPPVHITDLSETHPIKHVLRSGEPLILPNLTDSSAETSFHRPGDDDVIQQLRLQTEMIVPLTSGSKTRGLITFALAGSERTYTSDEILLAQDLARLASRALENARLYEETVSAAEERQRILSVASHELNNILSIISGFAGIINDHIERELIRGDDVVPLMDEMNSGIARLEYLVEDLATAATIQRQRLELNPEPLNLTELLRETVAHLEHSPYRTEEHRLIVDVPECVKGEWDAEQLNRMFSNILLNALKYSPKGGEIRITLQASDERATISMSDQGIGIPAANRQRLFQAFTRAEDAQALTSGTGVGLYIAREVIEHHGGTISLDSEPGQGTTVTVQLPLSPPALSAP